MSLDYKVDLNRRKCTLAFKFETGQPERLRIIVLDPLKPNTVYANGAITINKEGYFYVRMPISPKTAIIRVYNERNGANVKDPSFRFNMEVTTLKTNIQSFNVFNPRITSFLTFISEFADNAGILSAGNRSIYLSDDAEHRIDYVDVIRNEEGRELTTPGRISTVNKRIELARKHIITYTVPGIVAVGCHEFSHGDLVKDPTKAQLKSIMNAYKVNQKTAELIHHETEADLNGLRIYLGSGFSRKEAYRVFVKVFAGSPSKVNDIRCQIIENFILNFEKNPKINYSYYYIGENGEKTK